MKQLRFGLNSPSIRSKSNRIEKNTKKIDLKANIDRISRLTSANILLTADGKWFIGEFQYLQPVPRKDFSFEGSFQEATGSILAMAQFFGVMPVIGVKSSSASELKFHWRSFRAIYSFIAFLFTLLYAGMTLWITFNDDIDIDRMVPVVFYGSAASGMFCIGKLATKWPKIMRRWEIVESKLPKYRSQKERKQLAHHLKLLALIVMISAIVEHILNIISIAHYARNCLEQKDPLKEFFEAHLSQFFTFVPFSLWTAMLGKMGNVISAFWINYLDLFLMMISIGLTSRFKQINLDLERIKGEHMSEEFWAMRRTQYRKLAGLCAMIDDAISQLTLISFSNNLFFISVQLFRSVRPMPSTQHAVYFWFSIIYFILRTLAVSLYSSQIHDESRKPLDILQTAPNCCIELQRFSEHVVNGNIALSGMRFFYLTRKLILSVAAMIVTYELVLIQFYKEESAQTKCGKMY